MAEWDSELLTNKFLALIENLKIDLAAQMIISTQFKAISRQINTDFWGIDSETQNSRYVGSYGRDTAIQGINDIDIAVELPAEVFNKYDHYPVNGQEALLQSLQNSLLKICTNSMVGSDGRTIVLRNSGIEFEVFPVFLQKDRSYIYPHASRKGQWRNIKLLAEIEAIDEYDQKYQGKIKHLTKLMRAWKIENEVPISGLLLETLVMEFLDSWPYSDRSIDYYGLMTQDFLGFLSQQDINQKHWRAKGSDQFVYRIGTFEHHAKFSSEDALAAMTYEKEVPQANPQANSQANLYWRKIFGKFFK